jgi:hypothetical protein
MKKAIILFLVLAISGLAFISCQYDDVTFCFNCGSRNIKKDGTEVVKGKEYQVYECGDCYDGHTRIPIAKR